MLFYIYSFLFFLCAAYAGLLDSILEKYLMLQNGREWFFLASALPPLSDVILMSLFNKWNISLKKRMIWACIGGWIGILFMFLKHVFWILLGRCLAGILYSILPSLFILISKLSFSFNTLPRFMAFGLSGYFVPPIFLFLIHEIENVFYFCMMICILILWIVFYWIENECITKSNHEKINFDFESIKKRYILAIQVISNLHASSIFYLVSPLCTNMGFSSFQIGLMIACCTAGQIMISLFLDQKSFSSLDLNRWTIQYNIWIQGIFCITLILISSFALSFHLVIQIWICLLLLASTVSTAVFLTTSNQLCSELVTNQDKMIYLIGMIASGMYIAGPLLNFLFLFYPAIPFVFLFCSWIGASMIHETACIHFPYIIPY